MNMHIDNSHELSRDAMLEKIILLTVSYFCVGTELRFLTHQQNLDDGKTKNSVIEQEKKQNKVFSEMWHA